MSLWVKELKRPDNRFLDVLSIYGDNHGNWTFWREWCLEREPDFEIGPRMGLNISLDCSGRDMGVAVFVFAQWVVVDEDLHFESWVLVEDGHGNKKTRMVVRYS